MDVVELFERINRLRAFVLDSRLPGDLANDLTVVLDAAEKYGDSELNLFTDF